MTRQITRTIKPRYISQGNTHHYRTPAYKRGSALGGKLEPMPEERGDRFHWAMRALFVAIALAGIVFQYRGGFSL